MRRCGWCKGEMPTLARRDAVTCSTRCRVARHRASTPAELRRRPRWVRYDAKKVPLKVDGSGAASSTDPETWSSHSEALRSGVGVGPGFVLNGDGIVCLDLDHCLVAGKPTPATRRLLVTLPATYIEVSPSGDGLHVWGRGDLPKGWRRTVGGVHVEAYGTGRYMTVTGRRYSKTSGLADLSGALGSM